MLIIDIFVFRWYKTLFMWYMWGEVYRENSSDDAQGYQPFTTYFWDYLIQEVIDINRCKYFNFKPKLI